MAEQATAAAQQPLALADRNAGREGQVATRGHGFAMTEGLTRYKQPSAATIPSARGRFAARTRNARPYGGNRSAAVQTAFRSHRSLRKRPLSGTGRCGHRPLQAATEVQRYKRLSAATIPSARGRFAARADECIGPYSAPAANVPTYYVQRENSCKNCCVRCLAVFRGSWSGLSENLCSRNSHPILLARAKPGRGRQYGTGQPGGAYQLEQCRSLGCTPRSPKGVRGPQPPARFRHFSAVKSAPPEANKPNCRSVPAECTRQSLPSSPV